MKTHELKTWPVYFVAVQEGRKTFEVRYDDRGFDVGDRLVLREWSDVAEQYTGREIEAWVTYILRGSQFGIDGGYVVMGLGEVQPTSGETLRRAVVQQENGKRAKPPGTIAWSEHLEAFQRHAERFGRDQSAERINERGGFGFYELVDLLGHEPKTWRPR